MLRSTSVFVFNLGTPLLPFHCGQVVEDTELVERFEVGLKSRVSIFAMSSDGCMAASGGLDGDVCLWNPVTNQKLARLAARRVHNDGTQPAAIVALFFKDGDQQLVAVYRGGQFIIWNMDTFKLQEAIGINGTPFCTAWSAHAQTFLCSWTVDPALATPQNLVTHMDGRLEQLHSTRLAEESAAKCIATCAGSAYFAMGLECGQCSVQKFGTHGECGLTRSTEVITFPAHRRDVISLMWSGDGRRLFSAAKGGYARMYTFDPVTKLVSPVWHCWLDMTVTAAAWSPDGQIIAIALEDMKQIALRKSYIAFLCEAHGEVEFLFEAPFETTALAFHPSGDLFFSDIMGNAVQRISADMLNASHLPPGDFRPYYRYDV